MRNFQHINNTQFTNKFQRKISPIKKLSKIFIEVNKAYNNEYNMAFNIKIYANGMVYYQNDVNVNISYSTRENFSTENCLVCLICNELIKGEDMVDHVNHCDVDDMGIEATSDEDGMESSDDEMMSNEDEVSKSLDDAPECRELLSPANEFRLFRRVFNTKRFRCAICGDQGPEVQNDLLKHHQEKHNNKVHEWHIQMPDINSGWSEICDFGEEIQCLMCHDVVLEKHFELHVHKYHPHICTN